MAGSFFCLIIVSLGIFFVESAYFNKPIAFVLGGSVSLPHQRAYMASLQENGTHICGGFLIAAQWVLSSAHCLEDTKNSTFRVLLGAHSLSTPEPSKRLYAVRRFFPHPGSRKDSIVDDLLLLQLEERAALGPEVQPLDYQINNMDVPEKTVCEVAGWGIMSNTGKRPDTLRFVKLGIMSRSRCNMRRFHDGLVTEKMMCAESRKKDSCKGDSGGPIVCNGIAEGIVTTGSRVCGNWLKPGIYTRIAPYAEWITSTMASFN